MDFKFKIGDRVKILDGSKINRYTGGWCDAGMSKYCGSISTVIERGTTSDGRKYYTLNSDDINDKIKIALMFDERGLKMANEERKIVITTDGTTTRAALYDGHKLVRESKTICSKEDTYDFESGAKIAFERLTAKPAESKPKKALKPLNTKIFVIDGHSDFKSGHIYEIKDGKIICDNGWKYPVFGSLYNMDDVHKYFNGKSDSKYNSVGDGLGGFSTKKKVTVMEVKED